MHENDLQAELAAVTSELATAKIANASLVARIAGLQAHRAALQKAMLGTMGTDPTDGDIGSKYRTDDIVEVLTARGTPMSIREVMAALHDVGRPNESYENVGADLAYLVERGRISRNGRGVYVATNEICAADQRIVLTLTQGNIRNGHVYLAKYLDFFPADAVGGPNVDAGEGRRLTLTFDGLPREPVETDIVSDKKIFRARGVWRDFFKRHGLQEGDKIVIDRKSDYNYEVHCTEEDRA